MMTMMKSAKTNLWVLAGAVALVLGTGLRDLPACDACNVAFGKEMEGARADSLIGQDFKNAVQKQGNLLKGSGLGSGAFQPGADKGVSQAPADEPMLVAQRTASRKKSDDAQASADIATAGGVQPPVGALSGITPGRFFGPVPADWKDDPFIEVIQRDYGLSFPPTSFVPQNTTPDKSFTLTLSEGKTYIGNGVIYEGFVTNGTVPGPLIVVDEGDIVEFTIENKGTVPHGASIHSAYTQTSKYLGKIKPGEKGRIVFRATIPGVYLYHCAPGGHAIPMHVLFGQYGMMVVKPKNATYEMEKRMGQKPDIEIYMIQHEYYASGKDAVEGNPLYTTFNGKLFRYVEEPIKAIPGDFVRIYFLNVGPNLLSTFHIVGIIWDFAYWQGNPAMVWPNGQTVTAGPSDSWVIDFRIPPDEGAYTILTHAVGSASRGAIGLIVAKKDQERDALITPEGLKNTPEEMAEIEKKAVRVISPFHPTSFDKTAKFMPGTRAVDVSIIGNSYWPKIIEVEPGTEVTWTNEDVFTYLEGEFAGIHNAGGSNADGDYFTTPLLAHGESASHVFEKEGEYDYTCAPHPYMKGKVIVKKPDLDLSSLTAGKGVNAGSGYLLPLAVGAFLIALFSFFRSRDRQK